MVYKYKISYAKMVDKLCIPVNTKYADCTNVVAFERTLELRIN